MGIDLTAILNAIFGAVLGLLFYLFKTYSTKTDQALKKSDLNKQSLMHINNRVDAIEPKVDKINEVNLKLTELGGELKLLHKEMTLNVVEIKDSQARLEAAFLRGSDK